MVEARALCALLAGLFLSLPSVEALAEPEPEEPVLDLDEPPQGARASTFRGSIALEERLYPFERKGLPRDQQLLVDAELELRAQLLPALTLGLRPWFFWDIVDRELLRYEPLEAYLAYESQGFDVLLGQFIESWGMTDGLNPLDVLNRRDYGVDFLAPRRRGELGLRVRVYPSSHPSSAEDGGAGEAALGLYVMPVWRATPFAQRSSRSALLTPPAVEFRPEAADAPSVSDGILHALRFGHTVSVAAFNADIEYLVARGPARLPVLESRVDAGGSASLVPRYYGTWTAGAGFRLVPNAATLARTTLKAEGAYQRPYAFADHGVSLAKQFVQYVVGLDQITSALFSERDQLTLTLEYLGEVRRARDSAAVLRPFEHDVLVRVFWEAFDFARTRFELFAVVDVRYGDIIAESSVGTQLRFLHDDLRLVIAVRYLRPGERARLWALIADNNRGAARLEFAF